jgi:hypothetical protein
VAVRFPWAARGRECEGGRAPCAACTSNVPRPMAARMQLNASRALPQVQHAPTSHCTTWPHRSRWSSLETSSGAPPKSLLGLLCAHAETRPQEDHPRPGPLMHRALSSSLALSLCMCDLLSDPAANAPLVTPLPAPTLSPARSPGPLEAQNAAQRVSYASSTAPHWPAQPKSTPRALPPPPIPGLEAASLLSA